MASRPNFFLIGAPKCGTTAVATGLATHPAIFVSDPKEPQYFLYAGGNPYGFDPRLNVSDLPAYLALFEGAGKAAVVGDASTLYIHAAHVAGEIARFDPQARIMAIVRNPVERAYSHYLFWHQYEKPSQLSPEDFREVFFSGALNSKVVLGEGAGQTMEFLRSFGFYHRMLKPYFDAFPREQILVATYDDLIADPVEFMRRTLHFLGVDAANVPEPPLENVTLEPKSRRLHYWLNLDVRNPLRQALKRLLGASPMASAVRDAINRDNQRKVPASRFLSDRLYGELIEIYRRDIADLSELVGRDFTPWLRRARLEPASRKTAP